ncbi:MAG: hypothetical protein HYX20_04310 [Candidatus Yanofskybacteria bacterium]|nr:hypothetical protein [Candidatus Yanofskybacteria bacterium]
MTDKEVEKIFAEELVGKSTREVLMASQNRIAIKILEKSAKPRLNDTVWKLLKDIAYAKSRLSMFLGITSGSLVKMGKNLLVEENVLQEAVFLHRTWLQVITFLYENYDNLNSEEFRKEWDKETTLEVKNELAKKYENLSRQFAATETLAVNQQDFTMMDQTFNWALLAILGSESFKQFMEEFNKTAVLLRKYQTELFSPSA